MGQKGASVSACERGFTLIELLVVILVIGVLAAIAIPVFLKQKENGYEAQMQSSLRNAAQAVEAYAINNGGSYAGLDGTTEATLVAHGFPNPDYLQYLNISANAGYFCLAARHNELTAGSEWRRSVFRNWVGVPTPVPDGCPALPAV